MVARRIDAADRWVADILDATEDAHGLVWVTSSMLPEGAIVLQLVTERGEALVCTPAVFSALEAAKAKIHGVTPVLWDASAGGLLGPDDPLACVDVTVVPQPFRGDQRDPMPTVFRSSLSASDFPVVVLLCVRRPTALPW